MEEPLPNSNNSEANATATELPPPLPQAAEIFQSSKIIKSACSLHVILSLAYFVLIPWSTWWVMGLFILMPIIGYASAHSKLRNLLVGM